MKKMKCKYLHFTLLVLFLFMNNMPVSSVFYNPFEYQEEETSYDETDIGYNDPNIESNNSMNTFMPLGWGVATDPNEDLATGASEEDDDSFNDVPLGDGFYILVFMVFMYAINRRVIKKRE